MEENDKIKVCVKKCLLALKEDLDEMGIDTKKYVIKLVVGRVDDKMKGMAG